MSLAKHISFLKEYWTILLVAFTAFWFVTSMAFTGLWVTYGPTLIGKLKEELGLNELKHLVLEATGETRILRQLPGQSYVKEPVYKGEPLTYVLTGSRTERGEKCTYKGAVPLFTTDSGLTLAGTFQGAGRQYTVNNTRTEMLLRLPPSLETGRISLQIQIEYECPSITMSDIIYSAGTFYELTTPVFFMLNPERGNQN